MAVPPGDVGFLGFAKNPHLYTRGPPTESIFCRLWWCFCRYTLMLGRGRRFGVKVGGVRDDDHPVAIALSHQVTDITFAIGPVGALTRFGPGHGPVIVHRH